MITAPLMMLHLTALPGHAGVILGHPVPTLPSLHESIDVDFADVPVTKLLLTSVDGQTEEHPIESPLDLLGNATIEMPPGVWQAATLVLDGPIRIEGQSHDGTFELQIEVGAIFLTIPEPVDTQPDDVTTTIRLGDLNWLTSDVLAIPPGDHLVVDATHPLHDELRGSFRYGSIWE